MIKASNLYFSYGDKDVLEDVSFEIPYGSKTSLMGRSGIGKTTLMRLLLGLEQPSKGEISGISDKHVSVVFQEDRLLPHINIYENIRLVAPKLTNDEIDILLSNLCIENTGSQYPNSLSGGMKRRVAIARAIAFDGDIFLIDEPFKGLDEESKNIIIMRLSEILVTKTLIMITHNTDEAKLLTEQTITV